MRCCLNVACSLGRFLSDCHLFVQRKFKRIWDFFFQTWHNGPFIALCIIFLLLVFFIIIIYFFYLFIYLFIFFFEVLILLNGPFNKKK